MNINLQMRKVLFGSVLSLLSSPLMADNVISDDSIVIGSQCVGVDCNNGESFGFDTIRLKENNLRIKFEDTSNSATFATNDWQITINDSASGGANKFSIDDVDGGTVPFTIEATAPSNTLYLGNKGRVGFGTTTPLEKLHVVHGNSPSLRLEQDGSSGFTSQAWDVGSNEANFFIRDVTNGSRLPFRIVPGASNNSLYIAADGDVGFGTPTPSARLDVVSASGKADLNLNAASSPNTPNWTIANDADKLTFSVPDSDVVEAYLDNQGNFVTTGALSPSKINLLGDTVNWRIINNFGTMRHSIPGSGIVESELDSSGNLSISGTLSQGSSRSYKTNILPIDVDNIVAKLANLPMATWSYLNDTEVQHIGPMAEDFYSAFQFGIDEKHIAPGDMAAVALITAQKLNKDTRVLNEKSEQKDREIRELKLQLAGLIDRIKKLEVTK